MRPTALLRSQRPHPPGCPASQRWLPPSGWGDTPHPRRNTPAEPTLCTRTRVCSCHSRSRCTLSRSSQRPAPHTCAHSAELAGSRSGTPRGSSAPGQAFQVPPEGLDLCPWWVAGCTRTPNSPGSHPRLGHGFLCPPTTVRAAWSRTFVTVPKAPVPTGEAPSGAWPLPAVALTGHLCELSACCALGPERPERGLNTHTLPGMHDHVTRRRDGHDAPRSPSPAAPASV